MVWLQKIPPMISALAFGYGVGMAAPDATLDSMRGALTPRAGAQGPVAGAPMAPVHAYAGYGPTGYAAPGAYPYPYPYPPAGYALPPPHIPRDGESRELARLRVSTGHHGGSSCAIHGRNYSEPPTYTSSVDRGYDGADDLDAAAQEALTRLQLPDFQVPVTRAALKYVRFLTRTNRGRDLFTSWLKRSGRYQEMIQQELREKNLPEDLIWVAMIESGFDPRAKSPAGAVGLWQFMRQTGAVYGLEVTPYMDDRKNPVQATQAATHHLRDLYQRFGSWDLAMAAYNMGYEQLLARIDRYGTTDFNELARQRALPKETSAYVPKIVAAALVANNLDRYGFSDVKVYKPVNFSELTVPAGTPLKTVAKAAGVSTKTLRKLNPHLLRPRGPRDGAFMVMIPPETLSRAHAALPAMLDMNVAKSQADILAPNDLAVLAGGKSKKNRHNAWTEDENLLRYLPKPKRRAIRDMLGGKKRSDDSDAIAEEFKPKRADREVVMYRVGSGDTLIGVAKQFVIDVDDLARDNGIDPDSKLREGTLLKLMVKRRVLRSWKRKAQRHAPAMRTKKDRGKERKKGKDKDA